MLYSQKNTPTALSRINVWHVFGLALFINGSLAFIALYFFDFELNPDLYHVLAKNLLNGHGYIIEPGGAPIAWRPPLYPLFLFCVFFIFGVSHTAVVMTQVVLNSITSILIMKIADRVFSPPVGLVSSIAYAFYPFSAYYLIKTQSEIFFIFLFFLFIWVLYKLYDNRTPLTSFVFGFLQGILILCKLFFKGFPVFFLGCLTALSILYFMRTGSRITGKWIKQHVVLVVMMVLGVNVALTPWLIRNYIVFDTFPVFGSGGGFTFWAANNVQFDGLDLDELDNDQKVLMIKELRKVIGYAGRDEITKENVNEVGVGPEVDLENESILYKEAVRNFFRYPGETLLLVCKKVYRLWFTVYSPSMQKFQWIVYILHSVLLATGILGIVKAYKKGAVVIPFIILISYYQIIYLLFFATVRYIVPIAPIFICSSVYLLVKNKYLAKIGGKTRGSDVLVSLDG